MHIVLQIHDVRFDEPCEQCGFRGINDKTLVIFFCCISRRNL